MKRIAVSAGLVALGLTAVQASSYGLTSAQASKAWSVEARLRGFYDDNVNLSPRDEEGSFGFELSPSVGINIPLEQTLLSATYTYSYRYYDRGSGPNQDDSRCDQTHQFDLGLTHSFSERYMIQVRDSFVYAEEPGLVDPASSFPGRAIAIRNYGSVKFSAELTRLLSMVVGYRNAYYNYEDNGLSDLLDRMEHTANIDLRWLLGRNTVGVIGYEFGAVGYLENDPIAPNPNDPLNPVRSQDRNNYSHKIYIGAEHTFNPSLQASVRVGGQLTDYYNDPINSDTEISPWAQANLSYTYSASGSATLGFSHSRNQTDQMNPDANDITRDQESSAVYLDINHRITPKLTGGVTGRYQHSTFNGGTLDGDTEDTYGVALNLTYNFNEHFSAEAGYNYDVLCSDSSSLPDRGYDRNRFYLGVTAAY